MVIYQFHFVHLVVDKLQGNLAGYFRATRGIGSLCQLREISRGLQPHLGDLLGHLTANGIDENIVYFLSVVFIDGMLHHADCIGVESSAKRAVGRKDHQNHPLHLGVMHLENAFSVGRRYQERLQDVLQHVGVRQHALDSYLRMVQLARGNHLHGTRNLAGALHAGDAGLDFFQRRHRLFLVLSCYISHGVLDGCRGFIGQLASG